MDKYPFIKPLKNH